ncbi:MAG: GAF domain-containing sensor histidine kinase [Chloroflexi bacterium]|nr:GAF domain-containing sensor histidine kinase [Chloroflexota bacterium]
MSKDIASIIKKEFQKLNWFAIGLFFGALLIQVAIFTLAIGSLAPDNKYGIELGIASVILVIVAIVTFILINNYSGRIRQLTQRFLGKELRHLHAANNQAKSLRAMASKMTATLSFEIVVEEALDVCSLALEEMGILRQSLVGAVFLFKGHKLFPVATRRFIEADLNRGVPGQSGVIGAALTQAEITVTDTPRKDSELSQYIAFQNAVTAVCIPLRAGFQIFGAMVISSITTVQFNEDHFDLFDAVADQAVMALQNAQLYQDLDAEKQRLIEADEAARKELARDLHDGPTQTIAAIAMRVNFIRSLINRDPKQAVEELQKVENLAKQTSKEIRGMLFTLRPLVLETQGLTAAVETVMKRLRENDGLNLRLVGGEHGDLLSEHAQSVVFPIVEEALGNARKYAKADLIEVRFWQEDDLFVAQVRDNGVGFDTADVNRDYSSRGSLGLVNMRERAERINGSLRMESKPGQGTKVMLVVPLSKHGRRSQS